MSNSKKSYGQIIILIVVVSFFFVPNSAFATIIGPFDFVPAYLFLISMVVVPIALTHLGIVSLKHFKPNLWNYIHSNRFIKIGLYFLVVGTSWLFYLVITIPNFDTSIHPHLFGHSWYDYWVFLPIILGILLISIGVTKFQLSNIPRLGIIFLAVGIGWVSFYVHSSFGYLFDSVLSILIIIPPTILFFSIGVILIIKHYKDRKKLINS